MSKKRRDRNLAARESIRANKAPEEKPDEKPPRETPAEFVASIATTIIILLFIITFNLQPFQIPSPSMEKTLLVGDHLFVDRISVAPATNWMPLVHYGEVHHGDIMVFYSPAQPDMHLVKRIIGLPGDRIHLRDGVLYRNGERVNEPYVRRDGTHDAYRDNFPSVPPSESDVPLAPKWQETEQSYIHGDDIVVPDNSYFAMGDNRDVSWDSRYWGFVPRANIVGRPLLIFWSFEGDPGIVHKIIHFFDGTRWTRMLHVPR